MNSKTILVTLVSLLYIVPVAQSTNKTMTTTEAIIHQIDVDLMHQNLATLVDFGIRYTGTKNCSQAEQWVFDMLSELNLDVSFMDWETKGYHARDIEATLHGSDEYTIIIGAHLDTHVASPGADDDGSGVVAVMELARVMSQYTFSHTIKFLIYTGEEVGAYGSLNHASKSYENNEKLIAMFNLDMIGYAATQKGGQYIRVFETTRGERLTDFCISTAAAYYDLIELVVERVPNYPGSDHQAYLDYGYDAIFSAHYEGYPYGHSSNDTLDRINFSYQLKATRLFGAVVSEMANKPIETYIEIKEPKEGYLYLFGRPISPIYSTSWYLGLRGTTIVIGRTIVVVESEGYVEKVIFSIDDRFWQWDYDAPYEWRINALILGHHLIKTTAYGNDTATDEMDIIALIPYIP